MESLFQNFKYILNSLQPLRPPVTPFHRHHTASQHRACNAACNLLGSVTSSLFLYHFFPFSRCLLPCPCVAHHCVLKLFSMLRHYHYPHHWQTHRTGCQSKNNVCMMVNSWHRASLIWNISFHSAVEEDSADAVLTVCFVRADDRPCFVDRLMWKITRWQHIQAVVSWSNCICHKDVISERWGAATSGDD